MRDRTASHPDEGCKTLAPEHPQTVHNSESNKIRRATGVSPWVDGRRIGIAGSVPVNFLRSRGSSRSDHPRISAIERWHPDEACQRDPILDLDPARVRTPATGIYLRIDPR